MCLKSMRSKLAMLSCFVPKARASTGDVDESCSSFDCIAEASDIVAVSCTCRQTKVVIPASTILRTCASPLSRDLYKQQLSADTTFKSSEPKRDTSVSVTRVTPPNCRDSVMLEICCCTKNILTAMINRTDQ